LLWTTTGKGERWGLGEGKEMREIKGKLTGPPSTRTRTIGGGGLFSTSLD